MIHPNDLTMTGRSHMHFEFPPVILQPRSQPGWGLS